jgi:hypothetical protein
MIIDEPSLMDHVADGTKTSLNQDEAVALAKYMNDNRRQIPKGAAEKALKAFDVFLATQPQNEALSSTRKARDIFHTLQHLPD